MVKDEEEANRSRVEYKHLNGQFLQFCRHGVHIVTTLSIPEVKRAGQSNARLWVEEEKGKRT